jgi:hypothetical protein
MIKSILSFAVLLLGICSAAPAQQNYLDPGSRYRKFGPRNGTLDSVSVNPSASKVNSSHEVVKYDRSNSVAYDNIKIYPVRKLADVSPYCGANPPKIRMKLYTTAPKGTRVEIQLGKKGDDNYPSGVHSTYQAVTTAQNQWEELTFSFAELPGGSQVAPTDVDKITVLFSPDSKSSDSYYFDDLIGPPMVEAPSGAAQVSEPVQEASPRKKNQ